MIVIIMLFFKLRKFPGSQWAVHLQSMPPDCLYLFMTEIPRLSEYCQFSSNTSK